MDETAILQQPMSGAIKAGWVCLLLGLVLMLIPFPLFYIFGPLCSVAFILAIVGLAQGQTGKGIALLISSIVLPPIFWFIGLGIVAAMYEYRRAPDASPTSAWSEADKSYAVLRFHGAEGTLEGYYSRKEG